ncbi:hypothetical protein [Nitrobacter hamburgensis]|nr:hypothetical protein [Nitrobacter hamburgensis]
MIDVAKELEERFDFAAAHYQSVGGRSDLDDLVELLERLRDTVDQIPGPMIERARELYEFVGPEQFEQTLAAAVQGVGRTFAPNDASDFVKMLDLSLSFLQAAWWAGARRRTTN